MQALPYIIMAVGTAAQMKANRDQADERRTVLNRQLEREDKATDQAVDLVEKEVQRYGPQARVDGLQQREQQAFDQAQADIAGAGGAGFTTAGAGTVSSDFLQTKAARAVEEGNRLTSIARAAAKARAPGMLNMDDSLSMAAMNGNGQNIWGRTSNMGRAAGLDADAVEQPVYGALGQVATSIGGAMASNGFGQQGAGTTSSTGQVGMRPGMARAPSSGITWGARQ